MYGNIWQKLNTGGHEITAIANTYNDILYIGTNGEGAYKSIMSIDKF